MIKGSRNLDIPSHLQKKTRTFVNAYSVSAAPMTLGEYKKYRGWELDGEEDPRTEGYIVVYPRNYMAFVKKDIFEKSYFEVTKEKMPTVLSGMRNFLKDSVGFIEDEKDTHVQRLKYENDILFYKIKSIRHMIDDLAKDLKPNDTGKKNTILMLTEQLNAMITYSNVLQCRISTNT